MKWFYESDGGDWWDGKGWRSASKDHYIVSEDFLHRIDLNSKHKAMKMLKEMESGLMCNCSEKAYLNWEVSSNGKKTWVIRCEKCGRNATQRAEIEHGMTNKHDCHGSIKSWLGLLKYEHEERIK